MSSFGDVLEFFTRFNLIDSVYHIVIMEDLDYYIKEKDLLSKLKKVKPQLLKY